MSRNSGSRPIGNFGFNTTVEKIKIDNGLAGDSLRVGQRLVINGGKT